MNQTFLPDYEFIPPETPYTAEPERIPVIQRYVRFRVWFALFGDNKKPRVSNETSNIISKVALDAFDQVVKKGWAIENEGTIKEKK